MARTKLTYTDLPKDQREQVKTQQVEPTRYAESYLKEAYTLKVRRDASTDKEERSWLRQREQQLLAQAQTAKRQPKTPTPSPSKRS